MLILLYAICDLSISANYTGQLYLIYQTGSNEAPRQPTKCSSHIHASVIITIKFCNIY